MDHINVEVIGLSAALQLLQQYYQSGVLHTDVSHAFRMDGPCMAYIVINKGQIASCYVEGKSGQRQSTTIETLFRIDSDEGSTAWKFVFQKDDKGEQTTSATVVPTRADYRLTENRIPIPSRPQESSFKDQQLVSSAVPRRIANLNLDWLTTWSPQQKRLLRMVYAMIDGHRSVAVIERSVLSSKATVQEALVILIVMQVITIDN